MTKLRISLRINDDIVDIPRYDDPQAAFRAFDKAVAYPDPSLYRDLRVENLNSNFLKYLGNRIVHYVQESYFRTPRFDPDYLTYELNEFALTLKPLNLDMFTGLLIRHHLNQVTMTFEYNGIIHKHPVSNKFEVSWEFLNAEDQHMNPSDNQLSLL